MIHYLSVNGLVQAAVLQSCRISDLVLAQQRAAGADAGKGI